MKSNTQICAKFESIGQPKFTKLMIDESVQDVIMAFAKWMLAVQMGSHIRLTIARNEIELNAKAALKGVASQKSEELLQDLASMFDQNSMALEEEES